MRKVLLLAVTAMALALPGSTSAGNFLTQFCWQKTPFTDIVKMSISTGGQQFELHGTQGAAGLYTNNFAGNGTPVGSSFLVGVTYAHNGASFGGCRTISETATLNISTLSGPSSTIGVGCTFGPSNSTWVPVACPAGPAEVEVVGPAQGE
jgi:hypothetical protein